MMLDFHKSELQHNMFEIYELHCDGEKIGRFLFDERETHNSLLTLNKGLDLTPDLLFEIASEIKFEFGNIRFVI